MIPFIHFCAAVVIALANLVSAHIALWHPSMWGFNKSDDPRPQDPLMNLPFEQWWFHGFLDLPPHPNDIMQLLVGQKAMTELSCDKDATSWWASGPGGNRQDPDNPDYPCPGQPTTQFHTNGINDLGGCALAVAYKSDANDVQPEDFVIFSVNQTCVWNLHTYFEVPADMPPCPNNNCICAWFWTHKADSGSEQNYMTGFQCNFTNAVSTKKLASPKVPRRCGPEQSNNFAWNYSNCTYGAKQPFYWYQAEGNNMHEDTYSPPLYRDLYNFPDGAQNDIFENSTDTPPSNPSLPTPTSTSGPANKAAQPSPSSLPPREIQTPAPDPHSSNPRPQSLSRYDGPVPTPDGHTSHPQVEAAKPTTTPGGHNEGDDHRSSDDNNNQPSHNDQDQSSSHHHHHHGHSDQCSCHHHKGSHHESRAVHPSWNYLRESERAEEHALRRAWGAHHRRSVDH